MEKVNVLGNVGFNQPPATIFMDQITEGNVEVVRNKYRRFLPPVVFNIDMTYRAVVVSQLTLLLKACNDTVLVVRFGDVNLLELFVILHSNEFYFGCSNRETFAAKRMARLIIKRRCSGNRRNPFFVRFVF